MTRKVLFLALAFSSIVLLNSCGVIFGGSKFRGHVAVKDHPNAEIYVNGFKLGNGEVTKLFPRQNPLTVEVRQEGCPTKNVTFDNTFRTGNFILSVVSWGLLGIAVDLGSGAAYKPDAGYNPNIQQLSVKDFKFTIDYSECKNP